MTDRTLKRLQSKTKTYRTDENEDTENKKDTAITRLENHIYTPRTYSQNGTASEITEKSENTEKAENTVESTENDDTLSLSQYVQSRRTPTVKSADAYYAELKNGEYYKNAEAQSRLVSEDVLGKYATMTGGLPSTAAVYAATDAGREYIGDVENELYKLAQSMYSSDKKAAAEAQENEQSQYRDMIDRLLDSGYTVYDIPSSWVRAAGYDTTYMNKVSAGNITDKINSTASMKYPTRQMFSAALAAYNEGGDDALMDYIATVGEYSSAPLIAYAQQFGKA